jgi:uracil-DNA glycosylase
MTIKHFSEFPEAWCRLLAPELIDGPLASLAGELSGRLSRGATIYPPRPLWFKALDQVTPDQVKVVILGQDPYHGAGEAMGLSFSVPDGVKIPPSLRNIFKELQTDVGAPPPRSGDLTPWAAQGVLLLNSMLTVEDSNAGAHRGLGWEAMTDSLIRGLAASRQNLVFLLWGASFAWKKEQLISGRHLIIKSAHPSPLSAYRGFFGSKPFSKANDYLIGSGQAAIDWQL